MPRKNTDPFGIIPPENADAQRTFYLEKIQELLATRYPKSNQTPNRIFDRIKDKNLAEIEKNYHQLEKDIALDELEKILEAMLPQSNSDIIDSITERAAGKTVFEINAEIHYYNILREKQSSIVNYVTKVLDNPSKFPLNLEEKEEFQNILQIYANIEDILRFSFNRADAVLQELTTTFEDINTIIENVRNRFYTEKIITTIKNRGHNQGTIDAHDASYLRELLTDFKDRKITHSGLIRLDALLKKETPPTSTSIPVRDILDEFDLNSLTGSEALAPQATEVNPISGKTEEYQTVHLLETIAPELARETEIFFAFDKYAEIINTTEKEGWKTDSDIQAIYEVYEHAPRERLPQLQKESLKIGEGPYLAVLGIDNPLHALKLSETEFRACAPRMSAYTRNFLTPQEHSDPNLDKISEIYRRILLLAATPRLTYFKTEFSSSRKIPTTPPKGVSANYNPTLEAYVRYTRFDQSTGKRKELFEPLATEETRTDGYAPLPELAWVMPRSGYEIERQNALLFLEAGWEEFDGAIAPWVEKNVNFRSEETDTCVSIASFPIMEGKTQLTKRFIKFNRYPIDPEKVQKQNDQITKLHGHIEHFVLDTTLTGEGEKPVKINAERKLVPVYIYEKNPGKYELGSTIFTDYEVEILATGWSQISQDQLQATFFTKDNYFTGENRFAYWNVLVVMDADGKETYYGKFSKKALNLRAIKTSLREKGLSNCHIQQFPLIKTYQNERESFSTVPDYNSPATTIEISLYEPLQNAGFVKCPSPIYKQWMDPESEGRLAFSKYFPGTTDLTVITIQNPYDLNDPWIFIRAVPSSRQEKVQLNSLIQNPDFIDSYIVEQYQISSTSVRENQPPYTWQKATSKKTTQIRFGSPEQLERDTIEKMKRKLNQRFDELSQLIQRLHSLRKTTETPAEIKDILEEIMVLNNAPQGTDINDTLAHLNTIKKLIERASTTTTRLLREEENKIIYIQPALKKRSFAKNPWAYVAAGVLAAFIGIANKFLPKETDDGVPNIPTTNAPYSPQPVHMPVNITADLGTPQKLNDASVPKTDAELIAEIQRDIGIAVHAPEDEDDSTLKQEARNFDTALEIPNLPVEPIDLHTAAEEAKARDTQSAQKIRENIGLAPREQKAEQTSIHKVIVGKGDTTIGLLTQDIMRQHPELAKIDVRYAVAKFALRDAVHSSIRPGNSIEYQYTLSPEGKLALTSIEHKKNQQPNTIKKDTPPEASPLSVQTSATLEVPKVSPYEKGQSILYRSAAGQYGTYTIGQTLESGLVKLEGNIGKNKSTLIVKPETLTTRGQTLDIDQSYESFGVKSLGPNQDRLQFISFDGGIETMIFNYFTKHKKFERPEALLATKKVMAKAQNILDDNGKKVYRRPPNFIEVGDSITIEKIQDEKGKDQYSLTHIHKQHPDITELPK